VESRNYSSRSVFSDRCQGSYRRDKGRIYSGDEQSSCSEFGNGEDESPGGNRVSRRKGLFEKKELGLFGKLSGRAPNGKESLNWKGSLGI